MRITDVLELGLVAAAFSLVACGQPTFIVSNHHVGPGLGEPVYDWDGNLLSGPDWRAELYGGPAPDSLTPALLPISGSRLASTFRSPGYFWGSPYVVVNTVLGVGPAWLQVKVWDVKLGATYEEAFARGLGGYGQSELFWQLGGCDNANPPIVPVALYGLRSFSVLEPIPEPSTWALAALGGAALWAGRRKAKR
jgi:hypothetical protein